MPLLALPLCLGYLALHEQCHGPCFSEVTRLFYYLLDASGSVVKSSTYGLTPPTEAILVTLIKFDNADSSQVKLYSDDTDDATKLDHTTLSSTTLMRAAEAFEIYATTSFSSSNFAEFQTTLTAEFQADFPGATLTVMAAEDCFSPTYG